MTNWKQESFGNKAKMIIAGGTLIGAPLAALTGAGMVTGHWRENHHNTIAARQAEINSRCAAFMTHAGVTDSISLEQVSAANQQDCYTGLTTQKEKSATIIYDNSGTIHVSPTGYSVDLTPRSVLIARAANEARDAEHFDQNVEWQTALEIDGVVAVIALAVGIGVACAKADGVENVWQ